MPGLGPLSTSQGGPDLFFVAKGKGGVCTRASAGAPALPCLSSNNSTGEVVGQGKKAWQRLSKQQRKVAIALRENAKLLVSRWGIEHVLFGTLTFDPEDHPFDDLTDYRVAQRHFNSLATHCFGMFKVWIRIMERHKSGVIHYHVLAVVAEDVRTNASGVGTCDFEAMVRDVNPDYSSANPALRGVWDFFGNNRHPGQAKAHGFGRNGWLPIRSCDEAVGRYVAKYVAKHVGEREERDKGARLVGYSRGAAAWSTRYSLVGGVDPDRPGCSRLWESPRLFRLKLARLATAMGFGPDDYGQAFKRMYGDGWCFWLGSVIESIRLPVYPTMRHALVDYPGLTYGMTQAGPASEMSEVVINGGRDVARSLAVAVDVAWSLRKDRKAPGRGQGRPLSDGNAESGMEGPEGSTFAPVARCGGTWIERTCPDD